MKDMKKLTILMVAVVAIGVFSLPSVLSLGTGQHKFYNGTGVECGKCHGNSGDGVYNELKASNDNEYGDGGRYGLINTNDKFNTATSGNYVSTIHNSSYFYKGTKYDCSKCHDVATGARSKTSGGHTGVKKAVICATCHSEEWRDLTNASGTINPPDAQPDAHRDFGTNANAGSNATYACMGCHTAVRVAGSPSYTYDPGRIVDGLQIGGNWSSTSVQNYDTYGKPMDVPTMDPPQ